MSDKDRISPYNINTTSRRQVMRIEKNISIRGLLVDLILNYPNSFIRTVWQTAGRIIKEILGA